MSYLEDILNQPRDLRLALAGFYSRDNQKQLSRLVAQAPRRILFSGMGSSNFCSQGAMIELNRSGFAASSISAGELLHYQLKLVAADVLSVLISQSGESAEIVKLVGSMTRDSQVVAITNEPRSSLARRGDYVFLLNVPAEESVTTRTYLASLLLVDMITAALTGLSLDVFRQQAETAIDALESLLNSQMAAASEQLQFIGKPAFICIIGRGYSLSNVSAGALFLQEVVKYPALAFDGGEFRHGPMEMVQKGFAAVVIDPSGASDDLSTRLALDIAEKDGRVILISNRKRLLGHNRIMMISFQQQVTELLSPIVTIAPIQLLADGMAKTRGIEAGRFRWGKKIMDIE